MLANMTQASRSLVALTCIALFACSERAPAKGAGEGRGGTGASSAGESGDAGASGTSLDPDPTSAQGLKGTSTAAGGGGSSSPAPADTGMACVALGETCMDDHSGSRPATTSTCCEGSHCGPQTCTNAVPPHCTSVCSCSQAGQSCREELNGQVTSEHACCDGFACTGCVDANAQSRVCVCRPK